MLFTRKHITLLAAALLSGCASEHLSYVSGPGETPEVGEFAEVPAGEFTMGSPTGMFGADESPRHTVYLDHYYIGVYEVTNEQYAAFLTAEGGEEHWDYRMEILRSEDRFLSADGSEKLPVAFVTWYDAVAYCEWLGGRLPTEAEWEKAARGPDDSRIYPWGNTISSGLANFANQTGGLWEVGEATGVSYYGCRDMAGNVWEWTSDWYDAGYYSDSPEANPRGPATGEAKVIRGGGYLDDELSVRCSQRYFAVPDARFPSLGFRCVADSLGA